MQRELRLGFLLLLGVLVGHTAIAPPQLYGQRSKPGLSAQDQQKYDDLMHSARRNELIGYVAAGVGLLFVVLAVPLKIYFDWKKKSRKGSAGGDEMAHPRSLSILATAATATASALWNYC